MQLDDIFKFSSVENEIELIVAAKNLTDSDIAYIKTIGESAKRQAGVTGNPAYFFNQLLNLKSYKEYAFQEKIGTWPQDRLSELSAFSKGATIAVGATVALFTGLLFFRK